MEINKKIWPLKLVKLSQGINTLRLFLIAFGILFLLLLAVLVTQYSTGSTIYHLREINNQTTRTLRLSNLLEELVGDFYGLDLQVRQLYQSKNQKESISLLHDEVADLRQRLGNWLHETYTLDPPPKGGDIFVNNIYSQLDSLEGLIKKSLSASTGTTFTPDERIYVDGLALQTKLEEQLTANMNANNELIGKILNQSQILSIIGILAVSILGTVLIRRLYLNQVLVKDLQHARNQAFEMARHQDQFIANISHEIRTPVNAISGFGKLLAKSNLRPDQQEYANLIQDAARLLLTLVGDLLDAAKLKENKLQLNPRLFRIRDICQINEKMLRRHSAEKGISLSFNYDSSIPEILYGDPDRLQQVLANLINNAIRFTPDGSIAVSLGLEQIKDDKAFIRLEVSDTGIGIAQQDQQRIFERFEQAGNAGQTASGGTGLGLSIVKSLVEFQGGTINVRSALGRGATFTVVLPYALISPENVSYPDKKTDDLPNYTGRQTYLGAKVLVAEDNIVNQLLLRHLLAEYNILPDVVNNGKKAVEYVQKNPDTDLIFMDIQMPEMRGDEAARIIQNNLGLKIPIIAISAFDLQTSLQQSGGWIPNGFVPKPVNTDEIKNILHKFLLPYEKSMENNIDNNWLSKNFGQNEDFKNQLLNTVKIHLPLEIEQLIKAIQIRNTEEAAKTGHSLTATASSIAPEGALANLVKKMRNLLQNNPPEWQTIDITMKMIEQTAEETIMAINEQIGLKNQILND
jgi:signal transduction histidine kinase/DNA-binding response OmpR family regulator